MKITKNTKTIKSVQIEINKSELLSLIRKKYNVPNDAQACIKIPGGGDWSNCDLYIEEDNNPIIIKYSEVTENNSEK